ncbi:MAG: hypothetical protein ACTH7W_03120 [Psychrobacter sp.]|uniref:hypothetical protein n=1 Tax=unclassified Psychrobacter TaxID=196806 RepID=UPI00178872BA|nr:MULTISPECIES: hypothetical protein [unclassified Psychrobacter]MBE0441826.1 hypothetical protein [Psychrobacter sp. FME13]
MTSQGHLATGVTQTKTQVTVIESLYVSNYFKYCAGNNQLSSLLTTMSDETNKGIPISHGQKGWSPNASFNNVRSTY